MRMITNQFGISKEDHAARVAFSQTALVCNHDDRHGERFIELSNEVHDFRARLTVEVARGFVGQQEPRGWLIKAPSQQSSLLLAAIKLGRAMSQSRTQTNATPTPAETITKASSAPAD